MKGQRKIYFSKYLDKCSADRLAELLISTRKLGLYKKRFEINDLPYAVHSRILLYYISR